MPLGVYLIVMFLTFVVTMGIATVIWFTTLRERTLVFPAWNEQLPVAAKRFIQDDLKCCGWFNATTAGLFDINELGTGFCANPDKLIPDPDPNVLIGCVDKLAGKVDFVLNTTFTSLYGFTGIELALFLTAACLANLRIQQKRFLRIDEKLRLNGKGGFV
ncbi:expressed protein [Phakopsora pachyrhizi]|nr:expressed protein [Phakopsora pachyrhizi]